MKPRLLDLFCGAGGAARGYQQAGFHVTGVDVNPQPHYAGDEFIQADVMCLLVDACIGGPSAAWFDTFDAIHASPPCQAYGTLAKMNASRGYPSKHPKLVVPVRYFLDHLPTPKPYVIENVPGSGLRRDLTLCGSMFGLRVLRHRYFESTLPLMRLQCHHYGHDFCGVYGDHAESGNVGVDGYERKPRAATIGEARDAMGIDWMDWHEIREALPPAYTQFIGEQLLAHLGEAS